MKYDKSSASDMNHMYMILEEMAEYICYLESLLDMHEIQYDKLVI